MLCPAVACCVAGDIRAAACSCLSFLSCHPLGATGDACLTGPHRPRLLQLGTFSALLKAALASSGEVGEGAMGAAAAVVQQTASVGIMYLATMVRGGEWEVAPGVWLLGVHGGSGTAVWTLPVAASWRAQQPHRTRGKAC